MLLVSLPIAPIIIAALFSLSGLRAQAQTSSISPPWEIQAYYYGWLPSVNSTLTQCGSISLNWEACCGYNNPPVVPMTMEWWVNGSAPYRFPVASNNSDWTVNLPTGGPYLMTMVDSTGAVGGVGPLTNVLGSQDPNGLSCDIADLKSSTGNLQFKFGTTGTPMQCQPLPFQVTGGTPPYKLTVLPAAGVQKMVSYSTGNFFYTLDVKSGISVLFAIEDSTGLGIVGPGFKVASSSDSSCLKVAETLPAGAPALATVWPGDTTVDIPTVTTTSLSPSNSATSDSEPYWKSHPEVIAAPILVVVALLAVLGIVIWRIRRRERNADDDHMPKANYHDDFNDRAAARFEAYFYPPEMNAGYDPPSYSDAMDHRMQLIPPLGMSSKVVVTPSSGRTSFTSGSSRDRRLSSPSAGSSSSKPLPSVPVEEAGVRYPPTSLSTQYASLSQSQGSPGESEQLLPTEPESPTPVPTRSRYRPALPDAYYAVRKKGPMAVTALERPSADETREPLLE